MSAFHPASSVFAAPHPAGLPGRRLCHSRTGTGMFRLDLTWAPAVRRDFPEKAGETYPGKMRESTGLAGCQTPVLLCLVNSVTGATSGPARGTREYANRSTAVCESLSTYSAATSLVARDSSMDKSCETPGSAMVMPKSLSIRDMVTALWVIVINLV